jgi:ElaB/YqjD/DUF883 family membrane-anchored ribosome-binding protein
VANQTFGTNDPNLRSTDRSTADRMSQPNEFGSDASGRLRNVTEGLGSAAEQVRERVDSTMEYFRDHDTQKMMNDLTNYVKTHPMPALIGALAFGFFAGRMLRRE